MTSSATGFEKAVGAVVFDSQGRLLLIRRGKPPRYGSWSLPGGRIRPGESARAAVEREVLEETGLIVHAGPLVKTVRLAEEGFAYEIEDYLCALVLPREPHAADDALDARWVPLDELAALGVRAAVIQVAEEGALLASRGAGVSLEGADGKRD
jgi:8-oxo-dGTP diphosphatase